MSSSLPVRHKPKTRRVPVSLIWPISHGCQYTVPDRMFCETSRQRPRGKQAWEFFHDLFSARFRKSAPNAAGTSGRPYQRAFLYVAFEKRADARGMLSVLLSDSSPGRVSPLPLYSSSLMGVRFSLRSASNRRHRFWHRLTRKTRVCSLPAGILYHKPWLYATFLEINENFFFFKKPESTPPGARLLHP